MWHEVIHFLWKSLRIFEILLIICSTLWYLIQKKAWMNGMEPTFCIFPKYLRLTSTTATQFSKVHFKFLIFLVQSLAWIKSDLFELNTKILQNNSPLLHWCRTNDSRLLCLASNFWKSTHVPWIWLQSHPNSGPTSLSTWYGLPFSSSCDVTIILSRKMNER